MTQQEYSKSADLLLLIIAAIWGFAFVAQRMGMDHIGPFAFNAIRFALGAISLVPLIIWRNRKKPAGKQTGEASRKALLTGGVLAGGLLFLAASLQQVGIVHTTAGNAGFITGLYMVFVPVLGLTLGQRTAKGTIFGIALAAIGLCLLSVTDKFTMAWGDLLVLLAAFFFAGHILTISRYSPRTDPMKLAFLQFTFCSLLSMAVAIMVESITLEGISGALIPILYGGLASVGVAYTLQVFAQKRAHPSHASIIMGLEAVFAVFGGWLFLSEVLSLRGFLGCTLMLAGMLASQLSLFTNEKDDYV